MRFIEYLQDVRDKGREGQVFMSPEDKCRMEKQIGNNRVMVGSLTTGLAVRKSSIIA